MCTHDNTHIIVLETLLTIETVQERCDDCKKYLGKQWDE